MQQKEYIISTNRIEAFSDGVIAIIITLMVFDIKLPELKEDQLNLTVLMAVVPKLMAFFLSFLMLSIFWVNHHQLFHSIRQSTRSLLWLNVLLLAWLCLIPFPTSIVGNYPKDATGAILFAVVLLGASLSFFLLRWYVYKKAAIMHQPLSENIIKKSLRRSVIGPTLYALAIPAALVHVYFSYFIFLLVPAIYFMPQAFQKTNK